MDRSDSISSIAAMQAPREQVDAEQELPESRFSMVCDIIVNLAAIAFAVYQVPLGFAVGLGVALLASAENISYVLDWIGQQPDWTEGYLYPVLGEILAASSLITAAVCGTALAVIATRATVFPALVATLVGYYSPTVLYERVSQLAS